MVDFTDPGDQPRFDAHGHYHAVFFHGVVNASVPIDVSQGPQKGIWATIPADFETKGVVVAVVANEPGAPTKESLVAGPGIILEQPTELATALLRGWASRVLP